MKRYQSKTLADTVGTIGSMLLFLLFAGCMLMIISVAAGTYNRISGSYDKTFGVTAPLRYISNKIKASDSAEIINDGSGLVLTNGGVVEVIYFSDGGLYERDFQPDDELLTEGGEKISDISSVSIARENGMIRIAVSDGKTENFTLVRG